MRIIPYRRHDNLIDGLVVTFVDIDRVKRAEEGAQLSRAFAESIMGSVRAPLLLVDEGLRIAAVNRAFYEQLGAQPEAVIGESFVQFADGRWNVPALVDGVRAVLADESTMTDVRFRVTVPKWGEREVSVSARRITGRQGHTSLVLLDIEIVRVVSPPGEA
jgi:two-component system CheB/CheR fusion protein